MGWAEFKKGMSESWAEAGKEAERKQHLNRNNASVGDFELRGGYLYRDMFTKVLAKDCTVELVKGSDRRRMTLTRITIGATAAGPLGGVVAALSTKDVSKSWIFVTTDKDEWKIKILPKHADDAILFLRKFTKEYGAQLEGDIPDPPSKWEMLK